MEKGAAFADSFVQSPVPFPSTVAKTELENYFDAHDKGAGIWKYRHYFPIYERHFRKFRGEEIHILEIGVYSGGSLEMWRHYFGERAFIYGVDINESCRVYENPYTRIDLGDQASRAFCATFRQKHPRIDIIIDDGGHEFDQQRVTFEEMFPHLQPGDLFMRRSGRGEHPIRRVSPGFRHLSKQVRLECCRGGFGHARSAASERFVPPLLSVRCRCRKTGDPS
jgi:hypothetical protein